MVDFYSGVDTVVLTNLGPGGYRFGDYWRMVLPLKIRVIAVAVPTILWWWLL